MNQSLTHFPEPGAGAVSVIESASAQAAAGRRGEAQRKREERAERKAQGLPDPRIVDAAIVSGLATLLQKGNAKARIQAKGGDMSLFRLPLESLMAEAMLTLVQGRHIDRRTAGRVLAQRLRIV